MILISNLSHKYDSNPVLENVSLRVQAGEIVCLLGASGSGKSTLLRIVAGFIHIQEGSVQIGDLPLATPDRELPPEQRRCGFVFQDHVLFPHLTVASNVGFGLQGMSSSDSDQVVAERLGEVGMKGYASRYPHELSGGEQQRVALARALAPKPSVMLLDEPFANVDPTLRRQLREDMRKTLRQSNVPSIIVTHDAKEAMELGDRIAVLHEHQIVQDDVPETVWSKPANQFIAELLSDTNAISGISAEGGIETSFGFINKSDFPIKAGQSCRVIARPDSMSIDAKHNGSVQVADIRFLGDRYVVTLQAGDELLRSAHPIAPDYSLDENVEVTFDASGILVYP